MGGGFNTQTQTYWIASYPNAFSSWTTQVWNGHSSGIQQVTVYARCCHIRQVTMAGESACPSALTAQ